MTEEEIIKDIITNFNHLDYDSKVFIIKNNIKSNIINLYKTRQIKCNITRKNTLYCIM